MDLVLAGPPEPSDLDGPRPEPEPESAAERMVLVRAVLASGEEVELRVLREVMTCAGSELGWRRMFA